MIYLHLQNRLISNSHCLTYCNKLLYVCEGEEYCELLLILPISYLLYMHRGMRETGIQIQGSIRV